MDECSFEFLQKYLGRYMLQVHLWKEEENPLPRMDMGLRHSLGLKDAEPALGALYAQAKSHVLYRLYDMFQCRYLFLLLPGEDPPEIPPEIFESDIYEVEVYYEDAENLPEELNDLEMQAPLRTLVINLLNSQTRDVVDTLKIDRIYYDDEGEADEI